MKRSKICKIIKKSGLFDPEYYLKTYVDVRKADVDPLKHFCKNGWREGRNPSANFNTKRYMSQYPMLKDTGMNPLLHYIEQQSDGAIESFDHSATQKVSAIINRIRKDPQVFQKFFKEVKSKGFKSAIAKSKFFAQRSLATLKHHSVDEMQDLIYPDRRLRVTPFYINPDTNSDQDISLTEKSVAIHIDISNEAIVELYLTRLAMDREYDLYLTISKGLDKE